MRKHLYLITEHPDESRVGLMVIKDSRMQTTAAKNEEGTTRAMNMETGDTYQYKVVGAGYLDYDDENEYEANIGHDVEEKLTELDAKHLEKAGLDPEKVLA